MWYEDYSWVETPSKTLNSTFKITYVNMLTLVYLLWETLSHNG